MRLVITLNRHTAEAYDVAVYKCQRALDAWLEGDPVRPVYTSAVVKDKNGNILWEKKR